MLSLRLPRGVPCLFSDPLATDDLTPSDSDQQAQEQASSEEADGSFPGEDPEVSKKSFAVCGSGVPFPGESLKALGMAQGDGVRHQCSLPDWPHPDEDGQEVRQGLVAHPRSLRYLLQCEGNRIVGFLGAETDLFLPLRLLARGYGITISGIWFRFMSHQTQQRLLQGTDSSQTSSPWSSALPTETSEEFFGVSSGETNFRVAAIGRAQQQDLSEGIVEREAEIDSLDSWDHVLGEFQDLHLRLAILVCQVGRDVSSDAERGVVNHGLLCLLKELSFQKDEVEWLLQLSTWEQLSENLAMVRSLAIRETHMDSQPLMHTRLVSNQEVNENLNEWADAMSAEFQSLLNKGAIEVVTDQQVRSWLDAGEDVEVLPGRGVASEKPPEYPSSRVRKKYRAVICGNFQKPSEKRDSESLYAGGADSLSIRLALRYAGLKSWGASSTDVKTAFLNATLDESEPKYLICAPPRAMIQAGVVAQGMKWWVRGALYGLTTSPRAWSKHRDRILRQTKWEVDGSVRGLWQCLSDPNVWLILGADAQPVGLLLCYVDDLLVLGPRQERESLLTHVAQVWSCSPAVHSESGDLSYCGLEVASDDRGLFVSQGRYVKELLLRHNVTQEAETPCPAWKEAYDDPTTREANLCVQEVRAAQSLVGELMWLSVRARPDVAFPVSRAAQLATKRPRDSISIGTGVLAYLKSTAELGLFYGCAPKDRGLFDQFPRAVVDSSLHGFTDISFGPSAGRSHQGIVVCWSGAPVYWESGRQSLTSLSTAEAELIGLVYGSQVLEAVAVLAEELRQQPCDLSLYGDNAAALAIATGPPTSWRTRHLRLRSAALRERVERGSLHVYHLRGEWMPADALTKAMPVAKFATMINLLNLGVRSVEDRVARVSWKKGAIALAVLGLSLLLKGQDRSLHEREAGSLAEDRDWGFGLDFGVCLCGHSGMGRREGPCSFVIPSLALFVWRSGGHP